MSLHLSDFDYHLPPDRIAQTPMHPRDHSRLLVLNRATGAMQHKHFYDLPTLLRPTDVLVMNNSKTMPMRTFGSRQAGGKTEVLFLKRLEHLQNHEEIWEVLTKPGLKPHVTVKFLHNTEPIMQITCLEDLGYTRKVLVQPTNSKTSVVEILHQIGELPTPHYIRTHLANPQDYQTIYAKPEGSAATPTAGLHFSPTLFEQLDKKGVQRIELTLHVGLGTFLPVKVDHIDQHVMHKEWFTLSPENAAKLNAYKKEGRRIIAVGTTTTRVLESCSLWDTDQNAFMLRPQTGETQAFFYPPYTFRFVDALITNFHLPKSTLLMLLSAFCNQDESKPFTNFADSLAGKAYAEAIKKQYRFFSFGDGMLVE